LGLLDIETPAPAVLIHPSARCALIPGPTFAMAGNFLVVRSWPRSIAAKFTKRAGDIFELATETVVVSVSNYHQEIGIRLPIKQKAMRTE
jgi:hypothetical protein